MEQMNSQDLFELKRTFDQPKPKTMSDSAKKAAREKIEQLLCCDFSLGAKNKIESIIQSAIEEETKMLRAIIKNAPLNLDDFAAAKAEAQPQEWRIVSYSTGDYIYDSKDKLIASFNPHGTSNLPTQVELVVAAHNATLSATPPPQGDSFEKILVEYFNWVKSTFPDETVEDQIGHLFEEFCELMTGKHNVAEEFADVLMLLCCVAHGRGFDIVAEFRKKLESNKARAWEKTSCGYRHAPTAPPSEDTERLAVTKLIDVCKMICIENATLGDVSAGWIEGLESALVAIDAAMKEKDL